ncbi:hypothetical protein [Tessaracoccus sp.]
MPLSPTQRTAPDTLEQAAGTRRTVDITALVHLHLETIPAGKIGRGSFTASTQTRALAPTDLVRVRQRTVKVAQVAEYIHTRSDQPIAVTDRRGGSDGGLDHLDGLHRLVAARLMGLPIQAHIWR